MIEFVSGDIFKSGCEAICNPVNCIGVMGAGLALKFKQLYPEMFQEYAMLCKAKKLKIGGLHFWRNPLNDPKWIINFPTKDDLSDSKIEYIQLGLIALRESIIKKKLTSVALPAIGSGLGGLAWVDVKNEIEIALLDYEDTKGILDSCNIKVYNPL